MHIQTVACLLIIITTRPIEISTDECRGRNSRQDFQPGRGWDALTSTIKLPIFLVGQTKCHNNSRFLIGENIALTDADELIVRSDLLGFYPNIFYPVTALNMTLRPLKWDHKWDDIDGFFTKGYETIQRKKIQYRLVTNRILVRRVVFRLGLNSDCPLHPQFRKRIFNVVKTLRASKTRSAKRKIDLIVRDYGTHYIHRVDTGAIYIKHHYLSFDYVKDQSERTISDIPVVGKIVFLANCSFPVRKPKEISQNLLTGYKLHLKGEMVKLIGGIEGDVCSSVKTWMDSAYHNMEVVDRLGLVLSDVINSETFPNLNLKVIDRLGKLLKQAVGRYYNINTHRGCLQLDSVNYDAVANFDNGSCIASKHPWPIGEYRYFGPSLISPPYASDIGEEDTSDFKSIGFYFIPSVHLISFLVMFIYVLKKS